MSLLENPKVRPAFKWKQDSEGVFARCRDLLRGSSESKYTYFMWDDISGLIKIGMSDDPLARRAHLNSSGARNCHILLTLRSGDLEMAYHRHFEDLRVRGEWFSVDQSMIDEIARLLPETNHEADVVLKTRPTQPNGACDE